MTSKGRKIRFRKKEWLLAVMLYLWIPIFLFLITWVKLIPAIIATAVAALAIRRTCLDLADQDQLIELSVPTLITIVSVILIMGVLLGWLGGSSIQQTEDWGKHNAILHDLMNKPWPVYYMSGQHAMLTYYIASYLIPAAVRKLTLSFPALYFVLYLQNCLGIFLVILGICFAADARQPRYQLLFLVLLYFFDGIFPIGQVILAAVKGMPLDALLNTSNGWFVLNEQYKLQYRSFLISLRWAFPQCIPAWLSVLCLMDFRRTESHDMALVLPGILYGTLSFIGTAVMTVLACVSEFLHSGPAKGKYLKRLFGAENWLILATSGLIILIYLSGNVLADKPADISAELYTYGGADILVYILFCACAFGVYAVLTDGIWKDSLIARSAISVLSLIPFVKMGYWNDFCMSVSTAPLFVIMVEVCRFLAAPPSEAMADRHHQLKKTLLVFFLLLASLSPAKEVGEIMKSAHDHTVTQVDYGSLEKYTQHDAAEKYNEDLRYNYYTYGPEEKLFCRVLARYCPGQ